MELWSKPHWNAAGTAESWAFRGGPSRGHLSGHSAAVKSWKPQNYCDNEPISIILEALECAHSVLQFWLDEWNSYEVAGWCARCETTVQATKSWAEHFRRHLNWWPGTNLAAVWSSKLQNYCDNESISVILAALDCAHSVVQLCLDRWKLYEVVDCGARCVVIARCWSVLRWSWHMPRLGTRILNWWELSALRNTNAGLARILSGRSLASSEYTGYFFIGCVLWSFLEIATCI